MNDSTAETLSEPITALNKTIKALSELRCAPMVNEYVLQGKIADALASAGVGYRKEHSLGKGMRVDFLTDAGIVIEVKKGKPIRNQVIRQIDKYAQCHEVHGVLIVVETGLRNQTEITENGKPCRIFGLSKQWGIAL